MMKDFENIHTKEKNNFTQDTVKTYQLLDNLKQYKPRNNIMTEAYRVDFAQYHKQIHQTKNKKDKSDDDNDKIY